MNEQMKQYTGTKTVKAMPMTMGEAYERKLLKNGVRPSECETDKAGVTYTTITEVADGDDNTAINGVCDWCLAGIYENFTFADGTPFGILEEE